MKIKIINASLSNNKLENSLEFDFHKPTMIFGDSGEGKTPFLLLILMSLGISEYNYYYKIQMDSLEKNEKKLEFEKIKTTFIIEWNKKTLNLTSTLFFNFNNLQKDNNKFDVLVNLFNNDNKMVINVTDIKDIEEYIFKELEIPNKVIYQDKTDIRKMRDFLTFISYVPTSNNIIDNLNLKIVDFYEKMPQTRFVSAGLIVLEEENSLEYFELSDELMEIGKNKKRNESLDSLNIFFKSLSLSSQKIETNANESKNIETAMNKKLNDLLEEKNKLSYQQTVIKNSISKLSKSTYITQLVNEYNDEKKESPIDMNLFIKIHMGKFEINTNKIILFKQLNYYNKKISDVKKEIEETNENIKDISFLIELQKKGYKLDTKSNYEKDENGKSENKIMDKMEKLNTIQSSLWAHFKNTYYDEILKEKGAKPYNNSYKINVGSGGLKSAEYINLRLLFWKKINENKMVDLPIIIDDLFNNFSSSKESSDNIRKKNKIVENIIKTNISNIIITIKKEDFDHLDQEVKNKWQIMESPFKYWKK